MHSNDDHNENNGKVNGSGLNGANGAHHEGEDKIVSFPDAAGRKRMERDKKAQEKAWQKEYKARAKAAAKANSVPFLNIEKIMPFIRVIVPVFIVVHLIQALLMDGSEAFMFLMNFGFVAANYTGDVVFGARQFYTPFTYMFIHADWMHLGVNCFMMAALGTAFERDFGTKKSVLFFIVCGLAGAALHLVMNAGSDAPLVGASAGISGYFASFLLMMHWRGMVPRLGSLSRFGIWPLVGIWLFLIVGIGMILGGPSLSWEAHLGGFLVGLFMTSYMARRTLKFWV